MAGYRSNYWSQDAANRQAGAERKRHSDFKRREHEAEWEREQEIERERKDAERGPWYIRIDGKIYKQKGQPKAFDWKKGANNYALAMLKDKPDMIAKTQLTKNPKDIEPPIAENDMTSFFKDLQKNNPKFKNLRVHGDPEHDELRKQDEIERQKRRTADAEKANQAAAGRVEQDRANLPELKALLQKLTAHFDPQYDYSDDYSFWSKQKDLHTKIQALKSRIAKAENQGVAEGSREMTGTNRDRFISRMSPSIDHNTLMRQLGQVVNSPEFNSDSILKIVNAGDKIQHPVGRYIQKEFDELQYDLGRKYEDYPEEVAEKLLDILINQSKQGAAEKGGLDKGFDKSHGSPYDCGGADSWYQRPYKPHKVDPKTGDDIPCETPEEIAAYRQGYKDNEDLGGHKDYRESMSEEFDGGGEYNDEVGMVKNDLHTIVRCTNYLENILEDDENVAEWVQEKIAIAKSMMVTVLDYVKSEHELGHVYSMNEWKKSTKAPVRPRNFVAKNATTGGAGAHKDKKKAMKQGETKHKKKPELAESNNYDRKLKVLFETKLLTEKIRSLKK